MDNVEQSNVEVLDKKKSDLCTKCGSLPSKPCKQCGAIVFMCKACCYKFHNCRIGVSHSDQLKALKQIKDEALKDKERDRQNFENELLKQELIAERSAIDKHVQMREQKHKEELEQLQNEHMRKIHDLTAMYKSMQDDYQARTKDIIEKYEFTIATLEDQKKDLSDQEKESTSQREQLRKQLEILRYEFSNLKKEDQSEGTAKNREGKLPRVATLKKKSKKVSDQDD